VASTSSRIGCTNNGQARKGGAHLHIRNKRGPGDGTERGVGREPVSDNGVTGADGGGWAGGRGGCLSVLLAPPARSTLNPKDLEMLFYTTFWT
jgi:hypothetical protein